MKETGAEVLAVRCDVQRLDDVQRLVKETLQRFGVIHILVNNAGSVPSIQFTDIDDAQWHQMLEGKLFGFIRMTREVVPHMRSGRWGRIVNIAGTAGWEPSNTAMAVGLNNAAVINWTKSMSRHYAADGVLVTTVAPGSIETPRQVRNRQWEADLRGNESRRTLEGARARYPAAAPRATGGGGQSCRFPRFRVLKLHDRNLHYSRWWRETGHMKVYDWRWPNQEAT